MKFSYNGKDFYIHKQLANQLDTFVYNLKDDWDFVIIITGNRMVRVGKSVLAQIIAAYLAYRIDIFLETKTNFNIDDIYFDSETMKKSAENKKKYMINIYDEGREGLAASKAMTKVSKDIIDFFNECGQLNHIFIIVLPDFFSLNEEIAIGRSEALINVYREEKKKFVNMYGEGKIPVVSFGRGQFTFFNRYSKSKLYDRYKSTRRKSYGAVTCEFIGDFLNQYAVDEEVYRSKKREALRTRKDVMKSYKTDIFRDREILKLHEKGLSTRKISKSFEEEYDYQIDQSQISRIINKYSKIEATVGIR